MGSRIMHLAISTGLLPSLPGIDRNRFLLGSLLPDGAVGGNSHRRITVCGGQKKTFDLSGFRRQYGDRVKNDPLYMGYYLHLIQDVCFRRFVYTVHRWDPRPAGNLERLHRDYGILNPFLIEKYRLSPDLTLPKDLETEPLLQACRYDPAGLLKELKADFEIRTEGEIFFFKREMAEDYVSMCMSPCLSEIDALQKGVGFTDELSLAWDRA